MFQIMISLTKIQIGFKEHNVTNLTSNNSQIILIKLSFQGVRIYATETYLHKNKIRLLSIEFRYSFQGYTAYLYTKQPIYCCKLVTIPFFQ